MFNDRGPCGVREHEHESISDGGQRSTKVNHTRSYHTRINEDVSPANDNCDTNDTELVRSTSQYHSDDNEVRNIVEKAAAKIRRGLRNLGRASILPLISSDSKALNNNAEYYEQYFWTQATAETVQTLQWFNRFFASCFGLIRIGLEAECRTDSHPNVSVRYWCLDIVTLTEMQAVDKFAADYRTRKNWQTAAEVINSLVNCLLKIWGWKAFLVYSALECTSNGYCGLKHVLIS
ncbi:hypothetical protein SBOR_1740 [Sclerotinia borealis F-4128]|uniref:Uncharacterized protein n=1 Tax=Sclerotinia borealis (strain F-4128) TaxID=1432307 RepID=W9CTH8_SCLBF|nr:hypothetical protein SBOR_1740 [Sclerotinia borealis F-4128]